MYNNINVSMKGAHGPEEPRFRHGIFLYQGVIRLINRQSGIYKMVVTALLLAVGLVLPLLLGQVEVLGQAISPLHIPVLLCGLTCGWGWAAVLGAVLPILRSLIFTMPPMPVAIPMAFEMAAYGALTGLMYPLMRRLLKKNSHLPAMLVSMLIAMVLGRFVGGAAKACVMGFQGNGYTLQAFIAAYFTGTAVGAVIHLIVVPAVALALEKAGLSPMGGKE